MNTLKAILLVSMTLAIIGCDSDDDENTAAPTGPDGMGQDSGGEMMIGTSSLADLVAVPLEGVPIDDGLDQVNADIMMLFGDMNGEPVSIDDGDTVGSVISRRQQAQ